MNRCSPNTEDTKITPNYKERNLIKEEIECSVWIHSLLSPDRKECMAIKEISTQQLLSAHSGGIPHQLHIVYPNNYGSEEIMLGSKAIETNSTLPTV